MKLIGSMNIYCDVNRHLICTPYTIDNLHSMAKILNIKRCWFHNSNYPHYGIPLKRVDEIISHELVKLIDTKTLLNIIKNESTGSN